MDLPDRLNLPRGPLAGSILVAVVWVVLNLVSGNFASGDLLIAGVIIGAGAWRGRARKSKPDKADHGIYGPPS
ncbi:MAG TPA: hypothetical protein VFV89_22205 [Nocardioides sp.]|uniref:hypothetical protein n=1 Tax=Nocardioides sp. TaxID=35761 RepID=UPI002E37E103|nr:hypothetical protein [Nocardioides sp.]HEX5090538.1 hypothetical protein [Nocardioides sp.]